MTERLRRSRAYTRGLTVAIASILVLTTAGIAAAATYNSPASVTTLGGNTLKWTGQGQSGGTLNTSQCGTAADDFVPANLENNYLLWVFTVGNAGIGTPDPVLHLSGTGSGDYTWVRDNGGEYKFITPYFNPGYPALAANVTFNATDLSSNKDFVLTISHGCGAAPLTPNVFTTIHNADHQAVTSIVAGGTVHDTATVATTLYGNPTGSVSFRFFQSGNCTGGSVDAGSASEAGYFAASGPEGPLAPGDYSFAAHFTSSDPSRWNDADAVCEPLHVSAPPTADLAISKSADASFDRTYHWDIAKSVDQQSQTIPAGDSATFNYTVSVTHDRGTDSGWKVTGSIQVNNPNNAAVNGVSVADSLSECVVSGGSSTITANGSTTFSYECDYATAPASAWSNTATVSWPEQTLSNYGHLAAGSQSDTAAFNWSDVSPAIHDGSTTVSDSLEGNLGTVSYTDPSPKTYSYALSFDGVSGTCTSYPNTASESTDGNDARASVEVCAAADLGVAKTAEPSFTRTYTWTIAKDVDQTRINSSTGDGTFNYTVSVTKDAGTDSGWAIDGQISVSNPNDFGDPITADLSDSIPGCVLDQPSVTVAAGATQSVGYHCGLADGTAGTNTATATWDAAAAHTPSGSASGSASYAFEHPTSVVNGTIHVTDTNGQSWTFSDSGSQTYPVTDRVQAGTCEQFDNIASIDETTQWASQSVLLCAGADLTVSKTAAPAFKRTYSWSIAKSVDKTHVEQVGGNATFNYTVNANQTGSADSDWVVNGQITVSNPNDWQSITADVSDAIDNGGSCTVAGGSSVEIAASASVTLNYSCTYSSAPSPAAFVNTATATWDGAAAATPDNSASGSANGAFGDPTSTVNKNVTITDAFNGGTAGTLGTLTATDPPAAPASGTYTYPRTVPVPAWNCVSYANVARIVETGDTAGQTVRVCGPIQTGALTMGYWQNKNGQGIVTGGASTAGVCNSATWLRQYAPFQDLSATASCSSVAAYVMTIIKAANASGAAMNAMLKGQMLATALDVYFSDPALGGNKIGAAAPIGGVAIDLTNIKKATGIYENTSSSFGGAPSLTVSQILAYAASQSNAGGSAWYGQVKAVQELAKDTFDAINNQWAFAP